MDGPGDCHTESSKSDRGEIAYDISSMWNLKRNDSNELIYKTETDPQRRNLLRLLRGRIQGQGREGMDREFGIDMCTLLYVKWITNKEVLYSRWNCT